jgi:hypothetical protein
LLKKISIMNWEIIKKGVLKEIESLINTIDPAIDVDYCLNLYSKILKFKISIPTKNDLDGLERTIYDTLSENFIDGQINDSSVGLFCKNLEQFIKKVYYILEEGEFVHRDNILDHTKLLALTPYLNVLNKIIPIFIDSNKNEVYEYEFAHKINGEPVYKINSQTGSIVYRRLYPSSLTFDTYSNVDDSELNKKYQNDFLLYFIKAIILKNEQSHQVPERSKLANVTNFNTTLVAELWIINFFKKELSNTIKKESYKNRDFDDYILSEIEKLKKQSSKFVSLNLKELTNQTEKGRNGFIEDLLKDNLSRVRILGQGGSGKTTTLEYLFYKDAINWLENPLINKLPVLISLGSLSTNETVLESIAKKTHSQIDYIEELLETDELKIYLDGINEIVENRESKKLKLQEIASLLENYPKLSLVITDRYEFDSYQSNMFNLPTFLIQKLNKDQIEEFVIKCCNNVKEQSEHVLLILKSKSNIQEILLRPLVLTRAIEIIKIENDLPEKEGQIIEKFLDILLKREKDEKKDPLLNVNNFKLLLSYAANEIYYRHKSNAPIHEFTFNKLLINAAEKFGLEKFNAGYISRIGYELEILSKNDDLIQFYHQSYLEFFCSHYLKYEFR